MLLSRTLADPEPRDPGRAFEGQSSTARSSSATRRTRRLPAHGQLRHGTRQDGEPPVPRLRPAQTTRGDYRARTLAQIIERFDHTGLLVFTVPTRMIAERRMVLSAHEADLLAVGHEGVILRDPHGPGLQGFIDRATANQGVQNFSPVKRSRTAGRQSWWATLRKSTTRKGFTNRATPAARRARRLRRASSAGQARKGADRARPPTPASSSGAAPGSTRQNGKAAGADPEALVGRTIRYRYFAIGVKDRPRHPVFDGFPRPGADLPESAQ